MDSTHVGEGNGVTGTAVRTPAPASRAPAGPRPGRRASLPGPSGAAPVGQGVPLRRRWGRFSAGAILALLGAWIFASLYISAGERVQVLALAADVAQYEPIEASDLRVVRVAAEPQVETVGADERDDLIGRRAATDLREGALLAPSHLLGEDERVVSSTEAWVVVEASPGQAPDGILEPGMDVDVVVRPSVGDEDGELEEYPGWLLAIDDPDDQTRKRSVIVVVPYSAASVVADAGADGRVAFVGLEGTEEGP